MDTKKVVLLGNSKSGKSYIMKKILQEQCMSDNDWIQDVTGRPRLNYHQPTLGVEVYPFNSKKNIYNIWDCGGRYRNEDYCIGSDIAIIFKGGDTYKGKTVVDYIKMVKEASLNVEINIVENPSVLNMLKIFE